MRSLARAYAAAALAVVLASCANSGGGYDSPSPSSPPPAASSPPPSPPPASPPPASPPPSPPPPPAAIVGESTSDGTVDETNAFAGDFRGPLSLLDLDTSATPSTQVGAKTSPGAPGDVRVSVDSAAGPEPTLTLLFEGATTDFDFTQAQGAAFADGFLNAEELDIQSGGLDWRASEVTFNLLGLSGAPREQQYSRLLLFVQTSPSGDSLLAGALSFGADEMTLPSTGTATYDTGVTGLYFADPQSTDFTQFVGRGDVSVSFGPGTMAGSFADVDFIDATGALTETANGTDFGLDMTATITGDDFAGAMTAVGVAMDGQVQGDFYGPLGGSPLEIGGAFALEGAGGVAIGGLQGACTCLEGTN